MQGIWTIIMLIFSNIFMTFAWYGHLKLQEMKISTGWPLILIILLSWGIAFFEYCLTVPANRIGFQGNGGPSNLMQLKVIQEVISLVLEILNLAIGVRFSYPVRTTPLQRTVKGIFVFISRDFPTLDFFYSRPQFLWLAHT